MHNLSLNLSILGTSLASGSDDLNIVVWDWVHEKPFFTFDSGHRSNVFQVCCALPNEVAANVMVFVVKVG